VNHTELTLSSYWLGGCGGCRLSRTDAAVWLQDAARCFNIVEHGWEQHPGSHVDITLIEGAVADAADQPLLLSIRERSRIVIALGACALDGNRTTHRTHARPGSPPPPDRLPVSGVIGVDISIPGCAPPVELVRYVLQQLAAGEQTSVIRRQLGQASK
jgi:NAD-reducing hydrogenase small subunit